MARICRRARKFVDPMVDFARRLSIICTLLECLILASAGKALTQGSLAIPNFELVDTNTGLCGTFIHSPAMYYCEEYKVRTRSGFELGVQKLWRKAYEDGQAPPRGPAFMYHGIMQGADIWVMYPEKPSLGLLMADAGYEVYLGNTRSSRYSFGHSLHTRDDKRFWDWGFDDMVSEDLPTMLQFVFQQTKAKISFVGYSQGTMTAFAALGSNNEVVRMISKAVMLAPVSYLNNVRSRLAVTAAWLHLENVLQAAGVHEFSAYSETISRLSKVACDGGTCYPDVVTALTGPNCCLNTTQYASYCRHQFQSTSLKNLQHLAQLLRTGRFSKFDFGWWGNLQKYGTFSPPAYYLSSIPLDFPMLLAIGGRDDLADPTDVRHLILQLKGSPEVLSLPRYAHLDFVLSQSIGLDVYDRVLLFLNRTL